MTKPSLYVPSRKKIACLLDKATATVFDREIATLSFVRALIADWLKSRQKRDQRRRESRNYDGQRYSGVRGSSANRKKMERERVRGAGKGENSPSEWNYIDHALQQQQHYKISTLFDLFPHLLKWREIQQSCLSGTGY